ncbi:MAG: ribosome recycling factor [Chthoniobacterales bacterium]
MDELLFTAEESMEKALDFMRHEFSSVRTGKASPALVDGIDVDAYGSVMKLKQVALISTPEPRLIVIQPFDAANIKPIEKAINESRIGISPVVDGKIIRLPIPELSEERRKDLVKTIKTMAEETRVRIRAARRHAMDAAKKMEKDGTLTEDDLKSGETQIQKLTDKFVADVDSQVASKETDIMKI